MYILYAIYTIVQTKEPSVFEQFNSLLIVRGHKNKMFKTVVIKNDKTEKKSLKALEVPKYGIPKESSNNRNGLNWQILTS